MSLLGGFGGLGGATKKLELLITANTSQAVQGVSKLQGQVQGAGHTMGGAAAAAGGFGGKLAAIAPYAKMAALGVAAIGATIGPVTIKMVSLAGQMEQTKIAFKTLLGSAKEADAFMRKMWKFAKETPFNFQGVARGARMLKAMGLETKKILPWMRSIGDATAAMGGSLDMQQRVVIAIGQMMNKNKVSMQEVRQLTEAGIPALDMLAKKAGITKEELSEMIDKKKFNMAGKEGAEAIIEGMNERFGGAMEAQTNTLLGQWEKLKDNIEIIMVSVGGAISKGLHLVGFLKAINFLLGKLSNLLTSDKPFHKMFPEWLQPVILNIQKQLSALGREIGLLFKDLAPIFKLLWEVLKPVLQLVGLLVIAFLQALVPALRVLVNALRFVINAFNLLIGVLTLDMDLIKKSAKGMADSVKGIFKGLADSMLSLMGTSTDGVIKKFKRMRQYTGKEMKGTADEAGYQGLRVDKHLSNWSKSTHKYLVQHMTQHIRRGTSLLATFPGKGDRAIAPFISVIVRWCSNWGKKWGSATLSWISKIVSYFRNMPKRILNAIKGFSLFSWGKNLITSIWRGIKSGLRGGPSKEKGGDLESMASAFFGKLGLFSGGAEGWGLRSDVAGLAKLFSSLFGLRVTSGFRPGARTASGRASLHASGRAVDMSGPANAMRAAFMLATRVPGVKEAIYGHMIYKAGRGIGYWSRNDHLDHVHIGKFHQGGVVGGAGDVPIMARAGEVIVTSAQFRKFSNAIERLNLVLGRISHMQTRFDILKHSSNYPNWLMKFFPSQMGRMASGAYGFGDAARQAAVSLRTAKVKNDIQGVATALNSIADLRSKFASHIQQVFSVAQNAIEQWGNKAKKKIEDTLTAWAKYYNDRLKQIDANRKASDAYYEEEFEKLDELAKALQAQRTTHDESVRRAKETEAALATISDKRQQLAELEAQQFLTAEDVAKMNTLKKEIYDNEQALAAKQAEWELTDKRAAEDAEIEAQRKKLEQQKEHADEEFTIQEEALNARNELEQEKAEERLKAIEEEGNKRLSKIAENLYAINKVYDNNLNAIVTSEGSYLSASTQRWQAWNEAVLGSFRSVMHETGGALGAIGGIGGIGTPSIGGMPSGLPGSSAREGTPVTWLTPGKIVKGTALVPIRELAAALGAQSVNWNAASQRASFFAKGNSISYKVGLASVDVGRTPIGLPVAPYQHGGVMYVPARQVAESIGAKVHWQGGRVGIQFHKGGKVPWSGWHQLLANEHVFPEKHYSVLDEFLSSGRLPALGGNGRLDVNHSFGRFVAEMYLVVDGDVSTMNKEEIKEAVRPLIKEAKRDIETKIIRDYESATTYRV